MRRPLRFEMLDSRLCMAFGDIDTNFAQQGAYSVSYDLKVNGYESNTKLFDLPDGLLFFANSQAGSGPVITMAKTDFDGRLDSSFSNGGMRRIVDPKNPISGMSDVIRLSDGSFVLQMVDGKYHMTLVGLNADGTLDSSFGDQGYLRLGFQQFWSLSKIVADPKDGFFLIQSFDQSGSITKYTPTGSVDSTFAGSGTYTIPRIVNYDAAVDAQGTISVVGLKYVGIDWQLTSIHVLANGTPDENYGVGGIQTNVSPLAFTYPIIDRTDGSIFLNQPAPYISDTVGNIYVIKSSANLARDASFGVDGKTRVEFAFSNAYSLSRLMPDGTGGLFLNIGENFTRPTGLSSIMTAKVMSNGTLDSNFGTDGIAQYSLSVRGTLENSWLDKSGNLFRYGNVQPEKENNNIFDFYMAKMTTNGSLDKHFGTEGFLRRDLTVQSQTIDQLQLLPNAGGGMTVVSGWPAYGTPNPFLGKATALNGSGNTIGDFAFGDFGTQFDVVAAPSLDGGWFAATFDYTNGKNGVSIRKFLPDGKLDSAFGTNGTLLVATERMEDLRIHAARDGSITVAAANWSNESDPATTLGVAVAVRIKANGALETTFGSGGILRLYQKAGNLVDVMHDGSLGTAMVFYDASSTPEITIQVVDAAGSALKSFGSQGTSSVDVRRYTWSSGAIDEFGRIVFVVSTQASQLPQEARLYQVARNGDVNSFGTAGALPFDFNYALDKVDLDVQHGVIAVAGTSSFDSAAIRLVALDYAGKPMTELGPSGFRDYDLSTYGESVEDLQFADDGSLWLAISDRSEFNKIGKVLRLGASTAAPKHNWNMALDVSGDKKISPVDALLVINRLQSADASPGSMPDTNGDAVISPIDALLVINWLNKSSLGSGEGEQEVAEAIVKSSVSAVDFVFNEFDILSDIRRSNRARR